MSTNSGESNEYAPICVGELTSENHIVNNIYANNVYKTLHEYDSCLVIRDDVVLLDNLGLFKSFQLISTLKNTIFTNTLLT